MPRKIDTPIIVARYGNKVIGWAGDDQGGKLAGDAEWVQAARDASATNLEFVLYGDIKLKADITDPKNPAGAFAALAWYTKERILVTKSPAGMLASLGLLEAPVEVDLFEGYKGEITEEDIEFSLTHVQLVIDGDDVWVPLSHLQDKNGTPELLSKFLKDFGKEDEPEDESNDDVEDIEDTATAEELVEQKEPSTAE